MATRVRQRVTRLLVVALMVLGILGAAIATPRRAYATTMKDAGAAFNLSTGTTYKSTLWMAGAGQTSWSYKINGYKVTTSGNVKTVKFQVVLIRNWSPTKSQVVSMYNTSRQLYKKEHGTYPSQYSTPLYWGDLGVFLCDFKTGANLASEKHMSKYGVSYYYISSLRQEENVKYKNGNVTVTIPKKMRCDVTIKVPADYKNLCIGVGLGSKQLNETQHKYYTDGNRTYPASWWYKNNNAKTHFKRVK